MDVLRVLCVLIELLAVFAVVTGIVLETPLAPAAALPFVVVLDYLIHCRASHL